MRRPSDENIFEDDKENSVAGNSVIKCRVVEKTSSDMQSKNHVMKCLMGQSTDIGFCYEKGEPWKALQA